MHDGAAALRPLTDWKDEVTLVPYSGIQILDFGFSLATAKEKVKSRGFLEHTITTADDRVERELVPLGADPERDEALRGATDAQVVEYTITVDKALEPFLGHWVPIPMLRLRKSDDPSGAQAFDPGPSSWARVRVVALDAPDPETGHDYRVQIALDTMLAPGSHEERYVAPDREDVSAQREFRFVSSTRKMSWFLLRPMPVPDLEGEIEDLQAWASDWLDELFFGFMQAKKTGRSLTRADLNYRFEHWARYLQFLKLIDGAVRVPKLRFLDTITEHEQVPAVSVDLILDIGNSRTCGIFVESFPKRPEVELSRSYPLELRDLSQPELCYGGLFESRVEFAELNFGLDRYARASGRGNGFLWPSIVRTGPEARRLTRSDVGNETTSGLSSPKRYLWDTDPIRQNWRFHGHRDPYNLPRNARAVMQYLNEAGDMLEAVQADPERRKDPAATQPAIRPQFSRSSVYAFMLSEIISHALVQINDPAGRYRREQSDLPRRLARIILTLPTATPVHEKRIMRERAEAALALVRRRMGMTGIASNISAPPELVVEWDEASCTQLVYLYSEITQKSAGSIDGYLALRGRPRRPAPDRPAQPSLRLACIDVGGGTTDLAVTTYFGEADTVLEPVQTFREGFRIAGDDLVRKVIARVVLPAIEKDAEAAGGRHLRGKLDELFKGDLGGRDHRFVQYRRQCVLRLLRPLATALIGASETAAASDTIEIDVAELLGLAPPRPVDDGPEADATGNPDKEAATATPEAPDGVPADVLAFLETAMQAQGATEWRLGAMTLQATRAEIDGVVRDVFGKAIGNMVEVIDHLGTDIVLLTGRPSRLPALRALIENAMVVPPDRLVSMHGYRTDRWYPYRDPVSQRISDPKSTVAVGGMLMALAGNRISRFKVRTDAYKMRSTASYIGVMEASGRISKANELFAPADAARGQRPTSEAGVDLYSPVQIGFRQLPLERWTTTPLYRLDFAPEAATRHLPPLRVQISRPEIDELPERPTLDQRIEMESRLEKLVPIEVSDAEDNGLRLSEVTLKLHTMGGETEYWLDSGIVGE
ncbi:virulence factor SrfB [uncultured Limimaricola sp.]|uniref:virulence factor SrfB n=1 Tax=uncultured Limimaricola sp. TaxID=2211667 RepID=UPI0030F75F08